MIGPECLDDVLPVARLYEEPYSFRRRVERFERRLIEDALREHGNTRDVARTLGFSEPSVVRKVRRGK